MPFQARGTYEGIFAGRCSSRGREARKILGGLVKFLSFVVN